MYHRTPQYDVNTTYIFWLSWFVPVTSWTLIHLFMHSLNFILWQFSIINCDTHAFCLIFRILGMFLSLMMNQGVSEGQLHICPLTILEHSILVATSKVHNPTENVGNVWQMMQKYNHTYETFPVFIYFILWLYNFKFIGLNNWQCIHVQYKSVNTNLINLLFWCSLVLWGLFCSAHKAKLWATMCKVGSRWTIQKNIWFEQPLCAKQVKILPCYWWAASRCHAWHPWRSSPLHHQGGSKSLYFGKAVLQSRCTQQQNSLMWLWVSQWYKQTHTNSEETAALKW